MKCMCCCWFEVQVALLLIILIFFNYLAGQMMHILLVVH